MRNIEDIEKDIRNYRNILNGLYAERDVFKMSKIDPQKYDKHKLYKFRFPVFDDMWDSEEFVGVIKKIWFSTREQKYMVEFCGLTNNLTHDCQEYVDSQWASFDADIQREVSENRIEMFIDGLQEISYDEFKEYYDNVFLSNMADRTRYWIEYYMNEKDEENGDD